MKKDPKKPRGKTTSYAFFVQTSRDEHKKKNPGTPLVFAEFSKKCSERWRAMSPKERAKFEEMAKNDKARYEQEMKLYSPPKGAKRGKKKKDPNAPKRPPSAFFVFCSEFRAQIKAEYPGISIGETAKKLGEKWSAQSDKDKAPFEAKAAKLKEKYEKEIAAYRAKSGGAKSDSGKKGGPGRPKKSEPVDDDDDDDDDDEDEEDEEDDDDDDDDDD